MRKIIKKLVIPSLVLASIFSCQEDEKSPFADPRDGVEDKGVFFRSLETSGKVDLTDLQNSGFALKGELVSDQATLGTVENVQLKVWFEDRVVDNDQSTDDDQTIKEEDAVVVSTIPAASFTKNDNGYLEGTVSATIPEVMDKLGLEAADIEPTSAFVFDLVINTDKKTFTVDNSTPDLSLTFFTAPFRYESVAVCPADEAKFVGKYHIKQTSGFVTAPWGDGGTAFSDDVIVDVVAVSETRRSFNVVQTPKFCSGTADMLFDLICGQIILPTQNGLCNCTTGEGWYAAAINPSSYDLSDDKVFDLIFTEVASGECSYTPAQTVIRFTKQ